MTGYTLAIGGIAGMDDGLDGLFSGGGLLLAGTVTVSYPSALVAPFLLGSSLRARSAVLAGGGRVSALPGTIGWVGLGIVGFEAVFLVLDDAPEILELLSLFGALPTMTLVATAGFVQWGLDIHAHRSIPVDVMVPLVAGRF